MRQTYRASSTSAALLSACTTKTPSIINPSCVAPCTCHKRTEHCQHQLLSCQTHGASSASAVMLFFAQATAAPSIINISCFGFWPMRQAHQASSASAGSALCLSSTVTEHHQHQLLWPWAHTASAPSIISISCLGLHCVFVPSMISISCSSACQ